jgi:ATP-binding cassette subfamily B protein
MLIEASGGNLSQGEKQLISFSRILLAKKRVVVMDEATASIDLKTEEIIQKRMEEEF